MPRKITVTGKIWEQETTRLNKDLKLFIEQLEKWFLIVHYIISQYGTFLI
jgi:hypothetical protein